MSRTPEFPKKAWSPAVSHVIALRGAWTLRQFAPGQAPVESRVNLPLVWAGLAQAWEPDRSAPFAATTWELTRRFGRPPIEPGREALALSLMQVPGLDAVGLNGEWLPLADPGASGDATAWFALSDGQIQPRNELLLRPRSGDWWVHHDTPWGVVALEIHSIGTGARPQAEGRPAHAF